MANQFVRLFYKKMLTQSKAQIFGIFPRFSSCKATLVETGGILYFWEAFMI